jgi:hypothetical protein
MFDRDQTIYFHVFCFSGEERSIVHVHALVVKTTANSGQMLVFFFGDFTT